MIGQTKIKDWLNNLNVDRISHFIILVGSKGAGKKLIAKNLISAKLSAPLTIADIKVEEVRTVIDTAYKVRDKVVYCFADADKMRVEAKNAMLKITEEPPENAYFVLTVQDDSTILATLKSRATVLYLEPYTKDELKTYFWENYNEGGSEVDVITSIADTPYDVDQLVKYGQEFIDFVELVVDNIADVEPANAFKSSGKLALKDENDKYELKLFWNTFINICLNRIMTDPLHYANGITVTCRPKSKCEKLGVNKQQLYDKWVFAIRSVWL